MRTVVAVIVAFLLGVGLIAVGDWNHHRHQVAQRDLVKKYAASFGQGEPLFVDADGSQWRVIFLGGACEYFDVAGSAVTPVEPCYLNGK